MSDTAETLEWTDLDQRAVDTVRVLAADAVQKTGNGHPGTAMSLAPLAYLLYQDGQPIQTVHDQHRCGLFSRADWMRLLAEVGFQASTIPFQHTEVDYTLEVFLGVKPT